MKERLYSLDLLRGLDMFLLTIVGPLVFGANKVWGLPKGLMAQFNHPWGGFTLWDIIMPLFIFMCGAAIPFALTRRMDGHGRATGEFWRHVLVRFVMLWVLGMCVQGSLLTLDPLKISPYCNTLQTIAAGYLITAMVMLVPSKRFQIAMPFVMLAIYGIALHVWGDYSKEGNITWVVEKKILSCILPADSNRFNVGGGYTWFMPTLVFGAITLAGYHSTMLLRSSLQPMKKALSLLGIGLGSLAVGWGLYFSGVPMIKQLFTVSFTLQAIGWSMMALALLYILTDILKFRFGMGLLILFGQYALTAYLVQNFFGGVVHSMAGFLAQGMPRIFGQTAQPFVIAVFCSLIVIASLVIRKRLKAR